MKKNILFLLILLKSAYFLGGNLAHGQINVQTNIDVATILNELAGTGVVISNIEIKGQTEAYGRYAKTGGTLPIEKGIIITTGLAKNAQGSNNTSSKSKVWGSQGDEDLNNIVSSVTNDACTISFDIKPTGSKLTFAYTFASEEYNEYVGDLYNDIFAFLISGQNPTGGAYNKLNIAIIPNTSTPVTINNVNNNFNTDFFHDNLSFDSPYRNHVQYDGLTKNLFVEIDVVPCAVYRLELKIADVGDSDLDSGVFIEKINSPLPTFEGSLMSDYGGILEGCAQKDFKVTRSKNTKIEAMRLNAVGQATFGDDYDLFFGQTKITALPFEFNMAVGENEKLFRLVAKADAITEPTETLKISLEYGCSFEKIGETATNIIEVNDFKPISSLANPNNQIYVCGGNGEITLESFSGKSYQWTSLDGSFTCIDVDCKKIKTAPLLIPATYTLSLKIDDCLFSQAVTVIPIEQDIQVEKLELCPNPPQKYVVYTPTEEIALRNKGRVLRYEWSRTEGISNNQLLVRGLKENGVYICKAFDQVSGCLLRQKTFDINIICSPVFEIPTAFTPNQDGLNDMLEVFTSQVTKFELQIFNAWGECVHIMRNPQERWDGKFRNLPAPAGTYAWQASYTTPLEPDKTLYKKGSLMLVK